MLARVMVEEVLIYCTCIYCMKLRLKFKLLKWKLLFLIWHTHSDWNYTCKSKNIKWKIILFRKVLPHFQSKIHQEKCYLFWTCSFLLTKLQIKLNVQQWFYNLWHRGEFVFITANKLQDHILLEFKTLFTDSLIFMIVPFRMIAAE